MSTAQQAPPSIHTTSVTLQDELLLANIYLQLQCMISLDVCRNPPAVLLHATILARLPPIISGLLDEVAFKTCISSLHPCNTLVILSVAGVGEAYTGISSIMLQNFKDFSPLKIAFDDLRLPLH